jgi:hypothetical protein
MIKKKTLTPVGGKISLGSLSSNGGSSKVKINNVVNVGMTDINPFTPFVNKENHKSDENKGWIRKKSLDIRVLPPKK